MYKPQRYRVWPLIGFRKTALAICLTVIDC